MTSIDTSSTFGGSRGQRRPTAAGFTLLEVVLVAAMGGLLLIAAITMVLTHLRSSTRIAGVLHLQDACSRVQFLLDREIEQAERASAAEHGLSLTVPGMTTPITYTFRPTSQELWRSGPMIDQNGRLDALHTSIDLLMRDVQSFEVNVANSRAPRYRLTARDRTGATYSISATDNSSGGAFCRAREID